MADNIVSCIVCGSEESQLILERYQSAIINYSG